VRERFFNRFDLMWARRFWGFYRLTAFQKGAVIRSLRIKITAIEPRKIRSFAYRLFGIRVPFTPSIYPNKPNEIKFGF
jgi:hypothetical protein